MSCFNFHSGNYFNNYLNISLLLNENFVLKELLVLIIIILILSETGSNFVNLPLITKLTIK
jgi:hypothetical protein